jgi:hypothetical protein
MSSYAFFGGYLAVLAETEEIERLDLTNENDMSFKLLKDLIGAIKEFEDSGDFKSLKTKLTADDNILQHYAMSKALDAMISDDPICELSKGGHYSVISWIGERFPEKLIVKSFHNAVSDSDEIAHWVWVFENLKQQYPLICLYELLCSENFRFIEFLLIETELATILRAPFKTNVESRYIGRKHNIEENALEMFEDNNMLNFMEHCCPNNVYNTFLLKVCAYVYPEDYYPEQPEQEDYDYEYF